MVFRHSEHHRHQRAHQVRNLRGGVQDEALLRAVVFRHYAARFHGGGDETLAGDALLHHYFGFFKCLFGIAAFLVIGEGNVVRPLGMHRGRAGRQSFFGIGHSGQRLVIHFDQIERVGCDVAVRGDDHGHRMSDEVDTILGQDGVRGHAQPGQ